MIEAAESLMVATVDPVADYVPLLAWRAARRYFVDAGEFDDVVAHFSLPAFDDGARPARRRPDLSKSGKFCAARAVRVVRQAEPPNSADLECGESAVRNGIGQHGVRRAEADRCRHVGAVVGGTAARRLGHRCSGRSPGPRAVTSGSNRATCSMSGCAMCAGCRAGGRGGDHQPGCAVSRATHRIRSAVGLA